MEKKIPRGMLGSTEPQARALLRSLDKPKVESAKDTGGKKTATTPKGVQKTPEQALKELEALRKKQADRISKSNAEASKAKKK